MPANVSLAGAPCQGYGPIAADVGLNPSAWRVRSARETNTLPGRVARHPHEAGSTPEIETGRRMRTWAAMSGQLPDPRLRKVYRLEVTLGEPLDFGEVGQGHRRIVPQTGGTFAGPEIVE